MLISVDGKPFSAALLKNRKPGDQRDVRGEAPRRRHRQGHAHVRRRPGPAGRAQRVGRQAVDARSRRRFVRRGSVRSAAERTRPAALPASEIRDNTTCSATPCSIESSRWSIASSVIIECSQARRRRNGRGLPRRRRPPRAACRAEVPAAALKADPGQPRAAAERGPRRVAAALAEHRRHLRHRRARRQPTSSSWSTSKASCSRQRVAQGPLPVREVVDVGVQVADALDEAHSRGIIHRDIKSANLIRTDRGLVKVLDFGLAKFLATTERDELVTQQQMTIAGMVVGTISYMAPEQALGRSVDHRADLFSLGVVLYELATGRIPFAGTSPTEIVDKILHETPAPPSSLNAAGAEGVRRDRGARAGEVADLPLPDGARHAPGPARAGRRARGVVPRQHQPRRGGDRQPAGLGDRALGGGDDLRQHHPRSRPTTGSAPASRRPSARISRTSTA